MMQLIFRQAYWFSKRKKNAFIYKLKLSLGSLYTQVRYTSIVEETSLSFISIYYPVLTSICYKLSSFKSLLQ
jgi:hypothetical protein